MSSETLIDFLPEELIVRIFKNLSVKDLLKICRLSKEQNRLCFDEELWKNLAIINFGPDKPLKGMNWYQTYKVLDKAYINTYQAQILEYIKEVNPEIWPLLYKLKETKKYKVGKDEKELDNIIIRIIFKMYIPQLAAIGTIAKDKFYLISTFNFPIATLSLDTNLFHITELDPGVINQLKDNGYFINHLGQDKIYAYAYLNKEQIDTGLDLLTFPIIEKLSKEQIDQIIEDNKSVLEEQRSMMNKRFVLVKKLYQDGYYPSEIADIISTF